MRLRRRPSCEGMRREGEWDEVRWCAASSSPEGDDERGLARSRVTPIVGNTRPAAAPRKTALLTAASWRRVLAANWPAIGAPSRPARRRAVAVAADARARAFRRVASQRDVAAAGASREGRRSIPSGPAGRCSPMLLGSAGRVEETTRTRAAASNATSWFAVNARFVRLAASDGIATPLEIQGPNSGTCPHAFLCRFVSSFTMYFIILILLTQYNALNAAYYMRRLARHPLITECRKYIENFNVKISRLLIVFK